MNKAPRIGTTVRIGRNTFRVVGNERQDGKIVTRLIHTNGRRIGKPVVADAADLSPAN